MPAVVREPVCAIEEKEEEPDTESSEAVMLESVMVPPLKEEPEIVTPARLSMREAMPRLAVP